MSSRPTPPGRPAGRIARGRRLPHIEAMEERLLLATILVTNTNDGGPGSLRAAILASNQTTGVPDVINFNITGSPGVQTIAPQSALPVITDPVVIDART